MTLTEIVDLAFYLGGSSAMNFYAWSKPPAEDMGAIECLGNTGWDWDSFFKYSLRAEK